MIPLNIERLKAGLKSQREVYGSACSSEASLVYDRVSTDTRKIETGDLFFALKGDNFDAHHFLETAVEAGARGLVVSTLTSGEATKLCELAGDSLCIFWVSDTLLALQNLAQYCRQQLSIPIIAVTGSNGKTSTKDLLKSVLGQKFKVSATLGNFNNHIGLPLTILNTQPDDEIAVWEMGMNHPGEIAELVNIGTPTHAVISSIGTAHIEFFNNQTEIAEEKASVAAQLPADGSLFAPIDTGFSEVLEKNSSAPITWVGDSQGLSAANLTTTTQGERFELSLGQGQRLTVQLPVLGKHMVANALLAAAVGEHFGLSASEIKKGLETAKISSGRLHLMEKNGVTLIDDTYNANPDSMVAALEVLNSITPVNGGKKVAILGKLGELGDQTLSGYQKVAQRANELGLELICVGEETLPMAKHYGDSAHHFTNPTESADFLKTYLSPGDVALFKGSRAAKMEEILHKL